MSRHIGKIKERLTLQVRYVKRIDWTQPKYLGWGDDNYSRYIFKDAEGNIYTWKTLGVLCIERVDENGFGANVYTHQGDLITIKGTVKAHTTYKDMDQTELTRVKLISVDEVAPTKEEIEEDKRQDQIDSLQEGDFIEPMLYSRYKKHYSDCETLIGSYDSGERENGFYKPATIKVIIRAGRMKNSGVRGEHFSGYQFTNELGQISTYRAVSEENAYKRCVKDHPDHKWELTKIYDYRAM